MKKIISVWLALAILMLPIFVSADYSGTLTKNYLKNASQNPWTTMGLVALGETNLDLNHLKNIQATSAVELEAPILAITAAGQNPKTFSSEDLVAKLKTFANSGQIGDTGIINDDIFGILALISAGEDKTSQIISNSKDFIISKQNQDGGWGYAVEGTSDSNTTAAAITALVADGISASDGHIQNAGNYLKTAQNDDGGFGYMAGNSSDPSSTAWAIWAITALSQSPQNWAKGQADPVLYLKSKQNFQGSFSDTETSFSPVEASYAGIAISGKTLPLKIASSITAPLVNFRIEGSDEEICEGQISALNALDLIKNAEDQCGYTYEIKNTSFGDYLNKINNDMGSGITGWQYAVNNSIPQIGAADYNLSKDDDVLWYFASWDAKITKLTTSTGEISSGSSANITVEYLDGADFKPLENAKVYYGTTSTQTNSQGQAVITAADGYYKIYADKENFVRSNSVLIKFGNPNSKTINLKAEVSGGSVLGDHDQQNDTVGFLVDVENLDFGKLNPGVSSEKTVKITNSGSSNITIESQITGDSLFKDNIQIENQSWRKFKIDINAGQEHPVKTKLSIPSNYSSSGIKSGQLIFWARAN